MVKEVGQNGKTLYICEECGMAYKEKAWAQKCEEWCHEHHSCNLEIIVHAVPLDTG
ncbi:hypothetical protein ACFLVJ_03085 [Chloroflexota bacterium]